MKLIYTNHLKTRLKERGIHKHLVKDIFEKSEQLYWDNLRDRHIVISKVTYKGQKRNVLAAYDKIGNKAEVVTIHPISDSEITKKVKSERWTSEKVKN